jgi:mannosyltransferase OCH1-like enzyme
MINNINKIYLKYNITTIVLFILITILLIMLTRYMNTNIQDTFINYKNIPQHLDTHSFGLPKIIHHICPNDFKKWHPKWFTCYESWIRLYPSPEYVHMHWDDDELLTFVTEHFNWFLDVYTNYDVNIKRYDISRALLLYHYGGIYADMDYIVYKNFYNELPQDIVSIPKSPYDWNEVIQNSLMFSPPKNIFWLYILDECYNRREWNVFSATGPQLLTFVLAEHPELVNVLPLELYNPNTYDDNSYDQNKIYCKHLLTTVWQT